MLIAEIENPKDVVAKRFKKDKILSASGEGIRISTSILNSEEDINKVIAGLKEILKI